MFTKIKDYGTYNFESCTSSSEEDKQSQSNDSYDNLSDLRQYFQ